MNIIIHIDIAGRTLVNMVYAIMGLEGMVVTMVMEMTITDLDMGQWKGLMRDTTITTGGKNSTSHARNRKNTATSTMVMVATSTVLRNI